MLLAKHLYLSIMPWFTLITAALCGSQLVPHSQTDSSHSKIEYPGSYWDIGTSMEPP